jgi:hypothetical protein
MRIARKPFHLIEGFRGCVPGRERLRLKALSRKMDSTPQEFMAALNELRKNTGCS